MASVGVKPEDDFVVYWTMGIRSGYASIILKAVGFDKVRYYEGSIYEWRLQNAYGKIRILLAFDHNIKLV